MSVLKSTFEVCFAPVFFLFVIRTNPQSIASGDKTDCVRTLYVIPSEEETIKIDAPMDVVGMCQ